MLFSEKIRLLRRERGLMQRKLAQAVGVDVPMYCRFEHGERRPKRAQVVKLARLLQTDADELVALWLAEEAMNAIGHDKMSNRAAILLRDTLDGIDTAKLSESDKKPAAMPIEEATSAETTPVVAVAMPAIDPAIVKAPECDPALRTLVKTLGSNTMPQYHCGEAAKVMAQIEDKSIDCIVTTLPYWHLRKYRIDSIKAKDENTFIDEMLCTTAEAYRVLKDEGSLWINMADAYNETSMQALPWRLAIKMMDLQGWMLRNDIIWNKQQGTIDGMQNHARNEHEYMFHFVKSAKYYYDDIKLRKHMTEDKTGSISTGERYRRSVQNAAHLTMSERNNAINAIRAAQRKVDNGEIGSFRLYLRTENEHSTSDPGINKTLKMQGYYIQEQPRSMSMPGDVWNITPERGETDRYIIAPQRLYLLPIVATCPAGGIVLDPYCGTGTACKVAHDLGYRSIGIDVNDDRLRRARGRVEQKSLSLF
ncbi:MAG: helix-turn-helix domain-containing protein [Muribaculaceae bacterium]|nr:helix-turn-helix domain-containing protein [Muribaculaceae bacterium]